MGQTTVADQEVQVLKV